VVAVGLPIANDPSWAGGSRIQDAACRPYDGLQGKRMVGASKGERRRAPSEHPVTHVFDWCGFLSAWLLVAGTLAQASRELQEGQIGRDDLARAAAMLPRPAPLSAWWPLLPPAYSWLRRRRMGAWRQAVCESGEVPGSGSRGPHGRRVGTRVA